MELHRFFRYAIEKMCKEKKSLNHFNAKNIRSLDASPFETLDKSTGTYVLKTEYQGYGATIE